MDSLQVMTDARLNELIDEMQAAVLGMTDAASKLDPLGCLKVLLQERERRTAEFFNSLNW